jgi:hypothetical protein
VLKFSRFHKNRNVNDLRQRLSDEVAALWKKTLRCVSVFQQLYEQPCAGNVARMNPLACSSKCTLLYEHRPPLDKLHWLVCVATCDGRELACMCPGVCAGVSVRHDLKSCDHACKSTGNHAFVTCILAHVWPSFELKHACFTATGIRATCPRMMPITGFVEAAIKQ